tara:strand:+ start:11181 stop:11333 length:153 start_codon:yes stop_codon:yes gene_type:complete
MNTVDSFAFYTIIGIFAIIFGNLIYESLRPTRASSIPKKCPAPCCDLEEE